MDIRRPTSTTEYKVGMRVPLPERKLDIRPAFDGQSRTSFKPARNGRRKCG